MATALDLDSQINGELEHGQQGWLSGLDLPFAVEAGYIGHAAAAELPMDSLLQILSAGESAYFDGLCSRASKGRAREWLLGRLVAKMAVRRVSVAVGANRPQWQSISILPDALGKPGVQIDVVDAPAHRPVPVISLSHTRRGVLALAAVGTTAIGVDLEQLARAPGNCAGFARHVLTNAELVQMTEWADCGELLLRYWVAKEAAAKAVGTGFQGQPKRFQLAALPVIGDNEVCHEAQRFGVQMQRHGDDLLAVAYPLG